MAKLLFLPILLMILTAVYFYRHKEINSFVSIHRKPIMVVGLAGMVGLAMVYLLFGVNFNFF